MNHRILLLLALLVGLSGCASTPASNSQTLTTPRPVEDSAKVESVDPLEGFNRAVFGFNDGVDTYFLKPVTKGYRFITPDFIENRISNFFDNLLEVGNIVNALLQGKGAEAANYTGRFAFNTTIGLAGFFDVADDVGLVKTDGEDFGQTLGAWGVESGPYIVLPFLGPSTLRDGLSFPVNNYLDPVSHIDHVPTRNQLMFLEIVDTRAGLLDAEKMISGDRYVFIRDAYLQRREYLVKDGVVEDTFGGDELPKGDF